MFTRIIATKKHMAQVRFVNTVGKLETRLMPLINTNKLLSNTFYKGVKAGNSLKSGGNILHNIGCLVSLYQGPPDVDILVIVLGSSGRDSKFNDTDKLVEWYKKLRHLKNKSSVK